MKTRPSSLLPLLRSDATGEMLARILLEPERWWTLAELGAATGVSAPTVTREVTRIIEAGIAEERRVGRNRLVSANQASVMARPLSELMMLTYGPAPVLEDLLADVRGVDSAFIYGSWARRRAGEPGPPPGDIDVITVGPADVDDVYDAARAAETRLGREVNIRHFENPHWQDEAQQAFVDHVLGQPRVMLDLEGGRDVEQRS